jgi:26S proteasome regulatory subunit N8
MPATTAETLSLVTRNVTVAPLVLLSAVDHYNRTVFKGSKRRVVGVLLGSNDGKDVRVSNSFAGRLSQAQALPAITLTNGQCPSRRTRRTRQCGSWITTTSRA